jgi:hypothetical protein
MILLQHHFLILFQNNAPKKEGANCAIITKDTKPMETNVYSKAKFYRWHKPNKIKKIPIFYYLRSVYYFFSGECFNEPMNP